MNRHLLAYPALAVAAFLFGVTFVVVKDAIVSVPPLAFIGWRFLLGSMVLLLLAVPRGTAVWRDGLGAGLLLFAGYALQTQGLLTTRASNSGLITGLFVVLTPLIAAAVSRRRVGAWVLAGTILAFTGLVLITTTDQGFSPSRGDLLTLGCALAFAGHIVFLSRRATRHPVVPFTAVQLLVVAGLSLPGAALLQSLPLPSGRALGAVVLTGVAVSAGAYLLQIWAQTVVGPSRTAVVLALEPAFAALSGALLLAERLALRGWLGAASIMLGIYVVLVLADQREDLPQAEAVSPAR